MRIFSDNNTEAFFKLLGAGLWENEVRLSAIGEIDFKKVYLLAEEQSVVGLIAAGMEHTKDVKIPQADVLTIVGSTLQLEQRNAAMNRFVVKLFSKLENAGIKSVLIKGQGVAQCYERPQWRACGDVDLLLSEDNYNKAKDYLLPLANNSKPERQYSKELGLNISSWLVELHGTQRTGLSNRIDKEVDSVQKAIFYNGSVRSWMDERTQVFLPSVDEDVFLVFTHFVKHFYKEVIGLRQICDWCRLLWTYRDKINTGLLEKRIRKAGLMTEWRAFAAMAVDYLGMPVEAMPLYKDGWRWRKKGRRIAHFIIKGGNKGRWKSALANFKVFPLKTIIYLPGILFDTTWLKVRERVFKI